MARLYQGWTYTKANADLDALQSAVTAAGGNDVKRVGAIKAVGDGVTADGPAFTSAAAAIPAGAAIRVTPGIYRIAANLVITAGMVFESGAILKPDAGVTVTISGSLTAALGQIFDLSNAGAVVVLGKKAASVARPEWWGAVGDLVADDTTPLTQAIVAVLSIAGGRLRLTGNYKITAPLPILLYTRWKILGGSRGSASIVQFTDNTPHFKFTKENAHTWEIADVTLDYNVAQPAANTQACGLYFDFDTHTGAGAYNGTVRNVDFDHGYHLVRANPATQNLVWGLECDNIVIGTSVTGGVAELDPAVPAGQPNNKFNRIYVRADAIAATSRIFNLSACENTQMDNIEINNALHGPVMLRAVGGTTISVGEFKIEGAVLTTADRGLVEHSDSYLTFRRFLAGTMTINPGAGNSVYLFKQTGGAAGRVGVELLDSSNNTLTSGSLFAVKSASQAQPVYFDQVAQLSNLSLTDIAASAAASGVWVNTWMLNRLSADRGDADVTLAMGDETIQFASTTYTAQRNWTLPPHTTNPTNVFHGARYRIVRDAAVPGNFPLVIKQVGGATLVTIPENTRAIVEVAYKRLGWVVVEYTLLNETSVSADRGDAAVTLTVNQSARRQVFNTPLTVPRAVALSVVGAKNGDRFRITRTAAATGASPLNIGTGPLKALLAGQWCVVEYDGAAWFLAEFGSVATEAAIAAPTAPSAAYVQAEAQSMKTTVDAIRAALTARGITL
jgi:hypothetical protein